MISDCSIKKEVPRNRLPWADITPDERIERLRGVIKDKESEISRLRDRVAHLNEQGRCLTNINCRITRSQHRNIGVVARRSGRSRCLCLQGV